MSTETSTDVSITFQDLNLNDSLLKILDEVGYEKPSPIQAKAIPFLLEGRDIIGQAQTGTGKTAAFALPLISKMDMKQKDPQLLVLTPTRELAIQVAEAFQKYATHVKGFHVLPVYGGADYSGQIRALKRGVHVIVGTPGRVMDHIRKGTMKLANLQALVLDEADEMLRMGFIDDVEWILEQTPEYRQIALFSATMPTQIRRIATRYLKFPEQITIESKTSTVEAIRQRFWPVSGVHKLDALTRILEAEDFDAMIVFVRTKNSTVELSDKLSARGYSSSALNGDIAQNQRERIIRNLKGGSLDIVVATDVAARGLDVERISHVINYDVPHDTESYVHRIGRTGRAGREGDAILFVAPREKRMLNSIERAIRRKIDIMELPSTEIINDKRIAKFKQSISDTLTSCDLSMFSKLIEQYQNEHNVTSLEIAAALARQLQGDTDFLLSNKPQRKVKTRDDWDKNDRSSNDRNRNDRSRKERDRSERSGRDRPSRDRPDRNERDRPPRRERQPRNTALDEGMQRYRIEVGHNHEVKPGNIVGAIANEADIESKYIGRISIYDDYSTVDLPEGMPKEVLYTLKKVWVTGQQLRISLDGKETQKDYSAAKVNREPQSGSQGADSKSSGTQNLGSQTSDSQTSDSQSSGTRSFDKRNPHDSPGKHKRKGRNQDPRKSTLSLKKRVRRKQD